jgi:hypothetical protein
MNNIVVINFLLKEKDWMVFQPFPFARFFSVCRQAGLSQIIRRWQKSLQVFFNFCFVFTLGNSGSSGEAAEIHSTLFLFLY